MIRFMSRATLLVALGLLVTSISMAGVPNAANSTLPSSGIAIFIPGVPTDPAALTQITVRDAANNPVNNSVVTINFTNCNDYVSLSTAVGVGNTLNCGAKSVSAVTNASGVAQIRVAGVGRDGITSPLPTQFCAAVTADGVPLGSLIASAYDLQGASGVNATDLGALVCKILHTDPLCPAAYNGRFDLNRDFVIGATDLGRWISCFLAGTTSTSASSFCP